MAEFEPRLINLRVMGAVILAASLIFLAVCLVGVVWAGARGPLGHGVHYRHSKLHPRLRLLRPDATAPGGGGQHLSRRGDA